jgi:putative ABC transport system permease protein
MELVSGRDFSGDLATDATSSVLVNEEAVRAFGWDEPLGKQIEFSEEEVMTVVGVVKDFHYQSLKEVIAPVIFHLTDRGSRFVIIRLGTNDLSGTLAFVGDVWSRLRPEWPFEYTFLDADYAVLYTAEERLGRMFGLFSALAIGIACLGLFGLAAFTAAQRSKEIGIRKVLGASVAGLIVLLSRDFAKLIAAAFVFAAPIAYVAANHWLDEYAYRITIPWRVFLLAGAGALGVALLAVSYQAVRTALADPVDSLRTD